MSQLAEESGPRAYSIRYSRRSHLRVGCPRSGPTRGFGRVCRAAKCEHTSHSARIERSVALRYSIGFSAGGPAMTVDEWKRSTNAGTFEFRTGDLKLIDAELEGFLADKNARSIRGLRSAFDLWRRNNEKGRATQFRQAAIAFDHWLFSEEVRWSPKTNRQIAEMAFNATRAHYEHNGMGLAVKSVNKRIFPFDDPAKNTPEHVERYTASAKRHARSITEFAGPGGRDNRDRMRAATAGNCDEMALFAFDWVLGNVPGAPVSRFVLSYRGGGANAVASGYDVRRPEPDHVFCVVGTPVNDLGNEVQVHTEEEDLPLATEELPNDMKRWPAHLWIVDAWANLCCAARDYPGSFRRKADKWAADGLKIRYFGKWVYPNDHKYINSVLNANKFRWYG